MANKDARSPSTSNSVTLRQAAAICQKSEKWVRNFVNDGFLTQERRGEYSPVNLVRGVIAYYDHLAEISSRKAKANSATDARTREIELRIAKQSSVLFPVEDSLAILSDVLTSARAEFAGLPAAHTRDVEERRSLEASIDAIFARLADKAGKCSEALRSGQDALEAVGDSAPGGMGGSA